MTTFFSPSVGGFFDADTSKDLPLDVIEITDEQRWELIREMSTGKRVEMVDGEIVTSPNVLSEDVQQDYCMKTAKRLLTASDWTQLADARNLLKNAQDFDKYRATVRKLFLNPSVSPEFPEIPKAEWK